MSPSACSERPVPFDMSIPPHRAPPGRLPALAIALALACAPRDFSDADDAAIRGLLRDQQAAWNRGDLDAFMAAYERSDALVFTSGGAIRRGFDATARRYRERYGGAPATMGHLDFEILSIDALGPTGAVVLGRWSLRDTPEAGAGVFSLAFRRGDEGWRIVHDHTSLAPGG